MHNSPCRGSLGQELSKFANNRHPNIGDNPPFPHLRPRADNTHTHTPRKTNPTKSDLLDFFNIRTYYSSLTKPSTQTQGDRVARGCVCLLACVCVCVCQTSRQGGVKRKKRGGRGEGLKRCAHIIIYITTMWRRAPKASSTPCSTRSARTRRSRPWLAAAARIPPYGLR